MNHIKLAQEFEALKEDPDIRHPEKHMLQHTRQQGQYQGCFSKSHWGGKRVAQKWDLLCQIAPKQAKTDQEVPNHLRALLGITTKKHSNSKFKESEASHKVPYQLTMALEALLMERIHLGEEITIDFASSVLLRLVKCWNDKLSDLQERAREVGQDMLKLHDQKLSGGCGQHDLEGGEHQPTHMDAVISSLRACEITRQHKSLQQLDC